MMKHNSGGATSPDSWALYMLSFIFPDKTPIHFALQNPAHDTIRQIIPRPRFTHSFPPTFIPSLILGKSWPCRSWTKTRQGGRKAWLMWYIFLFVSWPGLCTAFIRVHQMEKFQVRATIYHLHLATPSKLQNRQSWKRDRIPLGKWGPSWGRWPVEISYTRLLQALTHSHILLK